MHLSKATDIALRVLMLAAAKDAQLTVDDLATSMNVPRNHVAKVVQRLQKEGLVTTARGRNGGVSVPPGARGVSAGHVVRRFEGEDEVVDCEQGPCPLHRACLLRGALRTAREAFFASLDTVLLRDLIAPPTGPVLLSLTRE
ncbi:Rrf2 family transcriptional regulator [Actinosynnema pretiosum subsp. pretiosum]|uniref:Transcriptional regulator, BadM/Rrf2 family n=2 Tax=Actinosynnema TaxID=40566 RepID=C6WD64_ACTMD|nr:Rrf2 family transcriptional regulator [Actinosynnema mirum]ACU37683.1 transcriptional regulator, BadM/Rrf2 family [Actinosynnema mirum DSM 43827]AXX31115.1 Nitrite-sensitive transcriptional repressor NsrR [Actinosynnema pretiosum subsp. pretiosum]QUF04807.1 Rrf2 family transcriptional regulator [Actinosynnema pretiosum subsp. pretiosum]